MGILKEMIKEKKKPQFDDFAADTLVLWKVSILVDENLKQNVIDLNLLNKDALSPVDMLSDVFPVFPVRKHVQILVRSPSSCECQRLFTSDGADSPSSLSTTFRKVPSLGV